MKESKAVKTDELTQEDDAGSLPAKQEAAWRFAKLEAWGVPLLLLLMLVPVAGSNILSIILSPLLLESEGLVRAMVLL